MKKDRIDGYAIVYCEGAFNTPYGKTAHGLVRFTERYEVLGVLDSRYSGRDAGEVLDGRPNGIRLFAGLDEAFRTLQQQGHTPTHLVIGIATDGGVLPPEARTSVVEALNLGLHVDSGLHDFLTEDPELVALAARKGCRLRDVRKTPHRSQLHFFSGEIEAVACLKIAVLGTDSAIGKRTTAWMIVHAMRDAGYRAELIGTGQTAWLQGAKYSMIMDSCINDFVAGEIEHAVVSAWRNERPDLIVIEGQGSLMNPAYPGGFEILAAGRPDFIILQHAPRRLEYDGFPGYPLHPLAEQINAIKVISGKEVIAVTLNHELMEEAEILPACRQVTVETGLPCYDVLQYGAAPLIGLLIQKLKR